MKKETYQARDEEREIEIGRESYEEKAIESVNEMQSIPLHTDVEEVVALPQSNLLHHQFLCRRRPPSSKASTQFSFSNPEVEFSTYIRFSWFHNDKKAG